MERESEEKEIERMPLAVIRIKYKLALQTLNNSKIYIKGTSSELADKVFIFLNLFNLEIYLFFSC